MSETLLIGAAVVSVTLFVIAAYFTRARTKRIAAALVGGVFVGALNLVWDIAAFHAGWWHYPFTTGAYGPWLLYVPSIFWFGAALGLIGWRVIRRFGMTGAILFVLAFMAYGVTRDNLAAANTGLLVFGPGIAPMIADGLGYGVAACIVQLVMWLIVGPPRSDTLARQKSA